MRRLNRAWLLLVAIVLTGAMLGVSCWSLCDENVSSVVSSVAPVAALATTVLTFVYVALTAEMVNNMIASTREESRPYVVVDFQFDPDSVVSVVVVNLGKTAATNVSVEFNPELLGYEGTNLSRTLFANQLGFLPPHRTITQFVGQAFKILKDEQRPDEYTVNVKYGRVGGLDTYEDTFTLSFRWYKNRQTVVRKGLHEIGQILEKIQKALESQSV